MIIYIALAGEYEVAEPLGCFSTEEKARQCVQESNPSYDTEILVYDMETESYVDTIYIPWSK